MQGALVDEQSTTVFAMADVSDATPDDKVDTLTTRLEPEHLSERDPWMWRWPAEDTQKNLSHTGHIALAILTGISGIFKNGKKRGQEK